MSITPTKKIVDVTVSGARGPSGLGGNTATRTSAVALSGQRVVKVSADGKAAYPDVAAADDADLLLGVTTGAVAQGDQATIQTRGEMQEGGWAWTLGPVFCGANGALTQAPPAGAWIRQVGVAVAADRIIIDMRPPIFTL